MNALDVQPRQRDGTGKLEILDCGVRDVRASECLPAGKSCQREKNSKVTLERRIPLNRKAIILTNPTFTSKVSAATLK